MTTSTSTPTRGRGRDLAPRLSAHNPNPFSKALKALAGPRTLRAACAKGDVLSQVSDLLWPRQAGGFAELFEAFGWVYLNPNQDLTKLQGFLETLAAFPADLMQGFVAAYSTKVCEPPQPTPPAVPATPRQVPKVGPDVETYDPAKHRMGGFNRVTSL